MRISEICQRDVVSLGKDASIVELAEAMRAQHVGDVIVTEPAGGAQKPLGIVTDRDLVVELIAKQADISAVSAGDVMSPTMATVQHDADLFETLRFMGIKGVRRVPVVDGDGGLFGLLSIDDAMAVLTKEISFVADIFSRQIEREKATRD